MFLTVCAVYGIFTVLDKFESSHGNSILVFKKRRADMKTFNDQIAGLSQELDEDDRVAKVCRSGPVVQIDARCYLNTRAPLPECDASPIRFPASSVNVLLNRFSYNQ